MWKRFVTWMKNRFCIHSWSVSSSEYLGDGKYTVISECAKCGKQKAEYIDTCERGRK